jgi:hypothetical protein
MEPAGALNEARIALSAAHRLGGENVFLDEEPASSGCCSDRATTRTCGRSPRT